MSELEDTIRDALGPEGALARAVDGFAPRSQQQTMAERVSRVLAARDTLVVEAGTGTGKTFAYLVPALLAGGKVVVSTGTRNLQDQLFHRDLPTVQRALGAPARTALLKGRANYLCLYRLGVEEEAATAVGRAPGRDLATIRAWSGRTVSGDVAEVTEVPEDASAWGRVTSTADNCLGQDCPLYGDCFVVKARRAAQEAELVVINHHLLFADMALKDEGFGELLPGADAFMLDEAHQLPEVAAGFFGVSLGARQLLELARDARAEHLKAGGDMRGLTETAQALERAVAELRLALGPEMRRAPWAAVVGRAGLDEALDGLGGALGALAAGLEAAAARSAGLAHCARRAGDFAERLELLTRSDDADHVRWLETFTRAFTLHLTPLDIAPAFRAHRGNYRSAWVFTSATLAVNGRFDHFNERLGLEDPETCLLDSPFDFARNALLYLPVGLPDPGEASHTAAVVEAALPVLAASGGRAFMLFTSYRALNEAAERLGARVRYPLFVQGSAPRAELLERFRASGDGVLLGTTSFWEGVDVRGPALSCVIIDKLPFAAPGDPMLQARLDALRARGANPFMDHQLPAAVILLKQGVGRLIRDPADRGVMMICDPRLASRPYGRVFLNSLPPMARTRTRGDVEAFFEVPPAGPRAGGDG